MFGNEVGVLSESVACAFDSDDGGVVEQPVEEGRRDDGVAEDVAPFGEASVRSEDHRAFFVSGICDLEEQACAALRDGQISDFIDDEEGGPREEADFFGELPLSFGFREGFGEFRERRFADALSGFDGGDAERGREVAFSGSGRSEEVDGFASPDEVELGQSGDSLPAELRLGRRMQRVHLQGPTRPRLQPAETELQRHAKTQNRIKPKKLGCTQWGFHI